MSETPTAERPDEREDEEEGTAVQLPETGTLAVVSGPSGVGKTAICDALLSDYGVERAITATTRPPREGERDGVDYYFYDDPARFRAEVEAGLFLEHAEVYENLYGTPIRPISAQLERGATVLLNIDVQGATELMDRGIRGTFIFLEPPSPGELERRLRSRQSDSEEAVRVRLETARRELALAERYHHRVVNDTLIDAVAEVAALLGLERRS